MPLRKILAAHSEGVIQFFYQVTPERQAEIYVLDEQGALFFDVLPYQDASILLNHYAMFFEAVTWRLGIGVSAEDDLFYERVEYYQILKEKSGYRLHSFDISQVPQSRGFFNLQVMVEPDADSLPLYNIYCEDQEFSSFEFGDQLFAEVARYILSRRRDGSTYPIYITDIDMAPSLTDTGMGVNMAQTLHYLRYKHRIEGLLNQAMELLGA